MIALESVLVRPVVTEKTVAAKNKFTFVIHPKADKGLVGKAVKEFYGVDAQAVHITKLPPKSRTVGRGREMRKRAPLTKAVVTLAEGTTLDFNQFK